MALQQSQALQSAAERERSILRNVYTWMTLGLAITGVVAMYVSGNTQLVRTIVMNRGLFFGLIIGELALVWILSANIHRMSPTAATLSFAGYALLNGVTLSVIFLAYTGVSIATTFFVTAGTFGALSLYAVTTNRDLGGMGQYLFAGLIGIIIASVVNMFLGSATLDYAISFIGVFLFMGLTAYDTQMIKRWSDQMGNSADEADYMRVSIMGALKLYLDFINLFLFLLRFLGNRR
ncbi:MAG: Bax inhibitor-1/YccA family protein [Spirochaeta sp.]|jgi:FtsH-binding integral membrane protein|nr:Bax inhibitor-1/YccA family protein [Spirochaeta sp.]